mgnify:FL=1
MNLYDLNSDNTIMNIDGKDIEMKPAMCYDKVYERWLVSKCGKIWSLHFNRLVTGGKTFLHRHGAEKRLQHINLSISIDNLYEDGSGHIRHDAKTKTRQIKYHKVVIDTWAPLYDNPPEGIVWEEWEIVRRDLPSVYNHINKTVCIDHIDDDPTNNHLDNLRRVTQWDNNHTRKSKGI